MCQLLTSCMAILLTTAIACTAIMARQRVKELFLMKPPNPIKRYTDPTDCRLLIIGKEPYGIEANQLPPHISRTLPNENLRRAFGIKNAFTSTDEDYVHDFVSQSRGLVNIYPDDWQEIAEIAQRAIQHWKITTEGACNSQHQIELIPMLQSLCLKAILWVFFFSKTENANRNTSFEALVRLSELINRTWIDSKHDRTRVDFEFNHDLRGALRAVLPDYNISDPCENPLNWILPGFETLWRVVLRMFIEIGFKTGQRYPRWREILVDFSKEPTRMLFTRRIPEDKLSARTLINEALRLYPPTKRVYRAWKEVNSTETFTIAADVEACHLAEEIWGTTASEFDPTRWDKLTEDQEKAFFPFGVRPFECPAKPMFGPRIIGVLVGTLLDAFQANWKLVNADGEPVRFNEERLGNERGDCYGFYLATW